MPFSDWLSKLLGAIAALVAIVAGIVPAVPPFKRWLRQRPVTTAALIGLATSLITTCAVLSIIGVGKIVADPLRIQKGGAEAGTDDPFVNERGADPPPNQAVLGSAGKQICTLSDVRTLLEAPSTFQTGGVSGSCELIWKMASGRLQYVKACNAR